LEGAFQTNSPIFFSLAAVSIFAFTSFIFLFYDWWVERRQKKVLGKAIASSDIVSSLFPSTVRDRLFGDSNMHQQSNHESNSNPLKSRMNSYLHDRKKSDMNQPSNSSSPPIADMFPEATVFFADISGFTAWSSMREPTQVFVLLEAVYGAFDAIADQRRVFKVETIGDSYVAVCGLPDPRNDHAVVMVKFSSDCRDAMQRVTKQLLSSLGPDTGDLKVRY
jgi:Adenylate and Guanylate cyclase catalytic domain